MRKKALLRYTLIALSAVMGAVLHFGRFDSYEIPYIVALQQAALLSNTMWFFQLYAHLGDSIVWVGLTALLLSFYFNRPKKVLKLALFIAMVAVVVVLLRLVFPRQRPFDEFPLQVQTFAFEGIPSYPSGHVAPAAGGFYLIADHSRLLNVVFGGLVILLALSRVATGTHYFTDVIGAALFSYPMAAIIDDMKLFDRFTEGFRSRRDAKLATGGA